MPDHRRSRVAPSVAPWAIGALASKDIGPICWTFMMGPPGLEPGTNAVPHVRLGKYVRFDRADLERWVETVKRAVS